MGPLRRGSASSSLWMPGLAFLLLLPPFRASAEPRQLFQVLEEQPPGTWVGTIATRPGFTYRLSEHHALFSINATSGDLHTRATIDRESLASDVMDLVVLSSQPTYPSEVRIVVLDLNDNAPVFPDPSIVVTFKEDTGSGRQLILDTATDADSGTNGVDQSSYRIVGGNEEGRFRLNITLNPSGEGAFLHLVSRGGLDREATPAYQLLVQVEDKGEPRRRGYLQVNVTVQDINDNPPVFSQTLYQARVPEDAPVGASVLQVAAADADEGTNADIRYRLEGVESAGVDGAGALPFEVDPESGVIRIREGLDYESRRQYSLTVQAIDRGVPALSSRSEALIHLLDVNDNEPRVKFRYFPATSRFASVDENAAPGTVVALLTVSDADSPAANGNISVSILGGNEQRHFEVQSSKVPNLSLIKVAAALDRERIPTYNLTVAVTDNFGAPPPSQGPVPSSLSPDGAIPVPVSRSSVASLVIFVNDINDHPPVFGQLVYQVNISEEVPPGSYVQGLSATDRDSGLNANLKYSIVSGNELGWFCISEHSGLVTTKSPDTTMARALLGVSSPSMAASAGLDREIASQVVLNISARDQGVQPKVSYARLVVNIMDVNDERPQFSQPDGYHISVAENSPPGTELLVLSALDGDLGDNGTVRFSLQETEPGGLAGGPLVTTWRIFRLDPVSGRLSTISQLDREEQGYYSLQVLATDLGSPALSSMVQVNVSLLDVNDNSPLFYPVQYFAHIQENEPAGSYVATVSASDPDLGLNGTVRYTISVGDTSRFQIHNQTGVITTKTVLDREEKTAYQLQIVASDGGNLQSQNQAIVTVNVLDTQDNPPVFSQDIYSFVVFENVALGYHVGSVSATTMDLNTNITYLITMGDQRGMFEINKMTGLITTASIIDREEQAFYQLKVVASGGAITGDALVNITVRDLNDNSPHFLHAVESVNVVENWSTGHTIFQAKAVDPDEGINGMVLYSLKQNPKDLFNVNEQSGAISLTGPLDINAGSYQVEIMASDLGVPRRSSSFILTVSVHDVNDNSPVFDQLSYEVTISELEPVNSRFFSVHASDKDSGANGEIAYNIIEGNTGDAFGIFPDGQLYIKSELDRELQERYILLVVASDRAVEPLSATVNVTVILEDVNDNRPLFNSTNYVFYYEEEQVGGSFVGKISAFDKDSGSNGEVRYSFEHMQPDFELNAMSGDLRSTHQLDRESLMRQRGTAVFTFTVIAMDQGLPKPLRDQATVQVYLKDINDNVPKFLKELYQATISELAANLTQVLRVSASDVDEGNNGLIHYSVIKGNEENQFTIDNSTGQVTLVGKLDHEATASYSLTIQAVDSGAVSLSSLCTLNIEVLDENDNSPSFPKSTLFVDVLENMRIGELVSSVTATDSDSGDNADLHYSITGTNNHGTFSISPNTGSIFLAKMLDFETQSIYKLNITAKDKGRPPQSSTMSVVIYVRDYNDNPPKFPPGDIFKSIVENIPVGSSVISVTAHDPDADINGQLAYTIIQQMPRGNHFQIDEVKGTIYTSAEIDREFANLFELTVKATDQAVPVESRRFGLKNVTILVTDQNDNVPTFVSQNALAADPSVVIGTVLTTIVAADPDEGENGEVEYEIINGDTDIFIVDRYSGELRVSSTLVASQLIYSFIVSATDLGPERRKSTTEMTVILQGLDGPVFTQPKYITILKEGEPIGTNVISIEAASPRGTEGLVEYFIVSVRCEDKMFGRLFTIGRHTGVIQTAAILDREQGARLYLVDVYAIEKSAVLPRTQRAEVEITLQDVNDNPPVFPTDMLDLTVEENIGDGSKIMQLTAMDADEGANALVTYTIISGADDSFHIDPESGELIATKRLDRERRSKYSLLVRADDGLQSSDMRINITVSDVNDHIPKFSKLWYSFDIPEDTTPGSLVAAILATDEDSGVNGEITYTVSEDDGDGTFFLNPVTGVFNLTCMLDYEMQQYYILTVCAEDGGGQSTTVRVYINILDVNDNSPVFSMDSYSTSLMENLSSGSTILIFNVTDADDGSNSQLSYSITSGDSLGQFNIDKNGILSIRQALDRESQSFYSLIVQVHDMASLPASRFTSTTQVSIILLDVNDNPPSFISPKLTYIPENTPIDTIVFKAQATDADSGPNSYIEYNLLNPSGSKFSIGTIDGEVRLTGELDRETVSNYTLTIIAADKGQPSLSSSTDVVVIVLDINDNNPVFAQKLYKIDIAENILTGTDVVQVSAADGDEGSNGHVRYAIISGNTNNEFRIDSVTGVVTVGKPLDREKKPSYSLTVQSADRGSSPRTDTTTVNIILMDVNDYIPTFELSPYSVNVPENLERLPKIILQVVARDDDQGLNSKLTYLLIDGNEDGAFILSPSGELHLVQSLDREKKEQYIMLITATDSGSPALTGTGTIAVKVDDVNDNIPKFAFNMYSKTIPEDAPTGTDVLLVNSSDADASVNAIISYSLSGGNSQFTINPSTGQIITSALLDRETKENYTLIIVARDGGFPNALSSSTSVLVIVSDVNDNPPKFQHHPYVTHIPSPTSSGTFVFAVTVTDADAGPNAELHYSLSGKNSEKFHIDPTRGAIMAAERLTGTSEMTFTVNVNDGGLQPNSDSTTVTVRFVNRADFPHVQAEQHSFTFPENQAAGTFITSISGMSSRGDSLSYYIASGNIGSTFQIDQLTGHFSISQLLDYEAIQKYVVWIEARDMGFPPFSSYVKLEITVIDINDNVPVFEQDPFIVEVMENISPSKIITVTAVDKDSGPNGQLNYEIVSGNVDNSFSIHRANGEIRSVRPLDRENVAQYTLTIKASDRGNPVQSTTVQVLINVIDENDNAPKFSQIFSALVPENAPLGYTVTRVTTADEDIGVNAISRYSLKETNIPFVINPNTGDITVSRILNREDTDRYRIRVSAHDSGWTTGQVTVTAELDRETLPVFNLSVLAIDSGAPSATGSASLLVTLEDINDNGPILSTTEGEIMENNRAGTLVMTLQSSDPDLPPNQGPFLYHLLSTGTATSYFSLSTAGVLTTTREIDREQICDFYLSVITRDSGIPQMSSTGTVHIKVIDQNDNPSQPRTVEIFVHYYGNLFPGGILGNVKPQDPDVLDSFQCSLTSGVTSLFSIPPGTCDLNSLARSTDGTFDLTVLSDDGLHNSVTSSIRVFFSGFNNATIDNSILLRLSVQSLREFLTNHYLHFLRIANSQMTGLGTAVQLYGVYEKNNRTFIMAAVKRNNYQYVNPGGVITFFESIKEILFRQSGVRIESVDHDSCLQNPCQNGGSCLRKLGVSPVLKSHDSVPVIIMGNEPLQPFTCKCMPGYDGTLCETDIDECLPLPCHNGGTCHNLVGGFSCSCPSGFTGMACERDINECLSSPCKNGALCQNFPGSFNCVCKTGYTGKICDSTINYCECNPCFNGGSCQSGVEGYYCHCPFGVFGKHCEVNSYGFEELSYMEFPSMDPNNNYIYIKFATIKSNALMLYNYDNQTGDRAEFLALEITEERLRFSYNLGSGTYKLTTAKKVSDGQFHTVIARRAGMAASLTVDSCSEEQEPGYCTVSNVAISSDWTLDVQPNRVTIGGIRSLEPILQRKEQVESHDFVGCIMEFAVNGRPLEPNQALSAEGILDQCPRLEGTCAINPCQHGGTCVDYWSWQQCHCKEGLTGRHCEKHITADTALSLEGKGRLDYHFRQNRKWEYMMRHSIGNAILDPQSMDNIEIKFRTRSKSGVLLNVQESSNYTTVKIKGGKVQYVSDAGVGGKVERSVPEVYVSDGHWHTVFIEKNGSSTILTVDKIHSRDILHVTQDFGGFNVVTISLGGIPPNQAHRNTDPDFDGCIAYLKYGEESLPFIGKHSLATISKTDPSVKIGCRGPNICASNPCGGELMCINQWYTYKCVPPGACASNPCQNGGSCEPGERAGFVCSCPEAYTGRACEIVVACLGVMCAHGHVCKGGTNGGHICIPQPYPAELSLPLWAVPAIVGSCATVLALLVLSLILCNQCKGKKAKVPKEEKKTKEKKKKGSENDAFDDPDNIPPYGDDMTIRKQPEGNPKPDIIERENPYLIFDETDIPHNTETVPSAPLASPEAEIEHYDIDNASSIAPSDADIIQHYKQFRSHTPKFSIQRHSPLGFARQSPMPLGASSLTYQPSYGQGLRTASLSHSACPTPTHLSRHSPAPFSKSSTFYRNSPAREMHLSIREGSPLEMHNDVCQTGIFNYPTRLGRRSKSPQMMGTHSSRPGSRLKQPIGQIPLESGPPVGLSIEEVERLNTPRPRNPSICSADHGRSSSEEDCRRPLSRTRNPADGIPAPESSSDSDSHDSFTCSEMEYDREKPMVYSSRMPKLSQVNESDADDEDNYGARLKPRRYPGRRGEGGGPVGAQATPPIIQDNMSPLKVGPQGGNFNWDNLLNWGPGFGHYVDVFKDLASLPEKTAGNVNEESKNGTTQPKDGEAEQYV
ncbi:protocadherin Fat 4 isoform X2 [Sceloporus undulatus]|uniref:protocadherin Fat 4 isoform X2 n=1 Tax=Sceloporus undulatus TaxID=8520 RepID=UPI001C4C2419|nr:protocadherin Fat 4 isoform X2 [Sceloporus undulatus]